MTSWAIYNKMHAHSTSGLKPDIVQVLFYQLDELIYSYGTGDKITEL